MATVSSHTLNGTNGTHAGGIRVQLTNRTSGAVLFDTHTDDGGRLSEDVDLGSAEPETVYELVFATGSFWATQDVPRGGTQIMSEVVLRFQMADPDARYHIPVILSPNSYSAWWSS